MQAFFCLLPIKSKYGPSYAQTPECQSQGNLHPKSDVSGFMAKKVHAANSAYRASEPGKAQQILFGDSPLICPCPPLIDPIENEGKDIDKTKIVPHHR